MSDLAAFREKIASADLPEIVSRIFEGNCGIPELGYRCQPPRYSLSPNAPIGSDFTPFWETNTVVTGMLADGTFTQFSLEAPETRFFDEEQFSHVAADLLIDLWEDDIEENVIRDIAAQLEYRDIDMLLKELPLGEMQNDYRSWRTRTRRIKS